jgi:hypothetical protein
MDFATSSGLAFASGINAYLPLLALGAAGLLWPGQYHINPQFAFIMQGWFLALMAVLALADLLADKIPGLDHVWDLIHTVLRPVAGAVVAAAADPQAIDGMLPVLLALGGGLAALTHVTKASTRATSTVTTGGCLNTIISVIEDIVMFVSVAVSLIAPVVMLVVVALFVIAFLVFAPRIIRTIRQRWRQWQNRGSIGNGQVSGGKHS